VTARRLPRSVDVMAPRILVCCVLGLALPSCGEDEREAAAPDGEPVARLVVSVDPNGCEIERWDDVAELLKAAG
jgi:hypothetical protein